VADRGLVSAGGRADYRLTEMRDAFAWFEDQLEQYVKQRRSGTTATPTG
jgi:lipase chaperone LimK